MAEHGTTARYGRGCRCVPCREAKREYNRAWYARTKGAVTRADTDDALSDLLNELFPMGLTDDCPARRAVAA